METYNAYALHPVQRKPDRCDLIKANIQNMKGLKGMKMIKKFCGTHLPFKGGLSDAGGFQYD